MHNTRRHLCFICKLLWVGLGLWAELGVGSWAVGRVGSGAWAVGGVGSGIMAVGGVGSVVLGCGWSWKCGLGLWVELGVWSWAVGGVGSVVLGCGWSWECGLGLWVELGVGPGLWVELGVWSWAVCSACSPDICDISPFFLNCTRIHQSCFARKEGNYEQARSCSRKAFCCNAVCFITTAILYTLFAIAGIASYVVIVALKGDHPH